MNEWSSLESILSFIAKLHKKTVPSSISRLFPHFPIFLTQIWYECNDYRVTTITAWALSCHLLTDAYITYQWLKHKKHCTFSLSLSPLLVNPHLTIWDHSASENTEAWNLPCWTLQALSVLHNVTLLEITLTTLLTCSSKSPRRVLLARIIVLVLRSNIYWYVQIQ